MSTKITYKWMLRALSSTNTNRITLQAFKSLAVSKLIFISSKKRGRMSEDNLQLENIVQNCPTEVLIYIFTYLKPVQLTKCRQVCCRWRIIIDSLCRSELLWRRHCKSDFTDIYKIAYYKCKNELTWHSLYRSLSLWSKLDEAVETRDEFASASCVRDEIRGFQVLRHGEIGVHTRGGIVYYDMKTSKRSNRGMISGDYLCYVENDDIILILGFTLDLFIMRKVIRSPRHETDRSFPSVKFFLLNNDVLYYVTLDNDIYICQLRDEEIKSSLLMEILDGVMCLGYKDGHLHALTFYRDIYTLVGGIPVFQCTLNSATNLLHTLNQYNFLDHLDWRVYFQWMFVLNHAIPQGSIRDIIVVKMYGDIVFVGSNSGVFRIYHCPHSDNEFDLFNTEPLKQFNFTERSDCPVLSNSPIIQIDVIEGEDSHTVLVGMPKKIAVLNFSHKINSSTSLPKLTSDDVQTVKIINTIES